MANQLVQARVDKDIKEEASVVSWLPWGSPSLMPFAFC